jgi:hypothetical protein
MRHETDLQTRRRIGKMKLLMVVIKVLVYITRTYEIYSYCDIADGTSDMNAAIQGPGTDFGACYTTILEYTGLRNTNPLLRNVYKQNGYFRGNEYC